MIFKSLIGLGKSRCDIPSGTTQRCFHPMRFENKQKIFVFNGWGTLNIEYIMKYIYTMLGHKNNYISKGSKKSHLFFICCIIFNIYKSPHFAKKDNKSHLYLEKLTSNLFL